MAGGYWSLVLVLHLLPLISGLPFGPSACYIFWGFLPSKSNILSLVSFPSFFLGSSPLVSSSLLGSHKDKQWLSVL